MTDMKIAIHHMPETFSERWIKYCEDHHVPYKIVNAYDSDIVEQVSDCGAFLWHFSHSNYKDALFAKSLLLSLQIAGKRVFPDLNTMWHFDDKVGQKYLLEAIDAPIVPSYIFYRKIDALAWIKKTDFPKVFKLRIGAGASNVRLVKTKKEAAGLIRKAFGSGFPVYNGWERLRECIRLYGEDKDTLIGVLKGLGRVFIPTQFKRFYGKEKGYVYFQDFIPGNNFDIRVIITGDKAIAIRRMVRKNDFRASGSGSILYLNESLDELCVKIAFETNQKIRSQSIAYDFVFDRSGKPLIVELSYGYTMLSYDPCEGYWTSDMVWHQEKVIPQYWQIENIMEEK